MKTVPKRILINLFLLVVICLFLYIALNIWLKNYTQHNHAIRVPDVSGLSVDEATNALTQKSLRCEVIDSMHINGKAPGVILEQKPAAGKKIKRERIIFLTINSSKQECAIVPHVKDFSQRQAVATLKAIGFQIKEIQYVYSRYRNLVLDVQYNGNSIKPGSQLPKGSKITLVVGFGKTASKTIIPDFFGMKLDSAILLAHNQNVNVGNITYDKEPINKEDATTYSVYDQKPEAGSYSPVNERIQLWMTKNDSLLLPKDSIPVENTPDGTTFSDEK